MKFTNPAFFWALLVLAIPILIHLFHFRRFRTVYFTNVRFLRELKEETQSRSRLKHLLVLLARCLALAALVTAFAQPFIPANRKNTAARRAISIYVDNSFSMDARGESSNLLDLAKKHAADLISAYKPTDRFQLITNDFEGKHQRLLSKEQFLEMLQEVKISPASRPLSEIYSRQRDVLLGDKSSQPLIYWISDFQSTQSDFNVIRPDTLIGLNCIHIKAQLSDNISIDSIWFETPYRQNGKADLIQIQLRNHSTGGVENRPVQVSVDGNQKGLGSLTVGADSSTVLPVSFSVSGVGFHSGQVKITDFPVVFDDAFYFSYPIHEAVQVLSIEGEAPNPFLERLYANDPAFRFKSVPFQSIDYSELSKQNLIILHALPNLSSGLILELNKAVKNGATLLVFPSLKADLNSYQALASDFRAGLYQQKMAVSQQVGSFNYRHPIYDDVFEKTPEGIDLPKVKNYIKFSPSPGAREVSIMKLQNGEPFFSEFDAGKGKIYQCAVPLSEEASNFQQHALFIPTLYKIALYSVVSSPLYYVLGNNETIELKGAQPGTDQTLKLKSEDGRFEVIPQHLVSDGVLKVIPGEQLKEAGNYLLTLGDSILARVSFNYNRTESGGSFPEQAEVEKALDQAGFSGAAVLDGNQKEIKQTVLQLDEGKPLWKWFVILALLFLLCEILLLRFLKP
jgi:hypothetical protein